MIDQIKDQVRSQDGYYSVYDAIQIANNYSNKGISTLWKRLKANYPEIESKVIMIKFPGQGQRLTPAANEDNLLYILKRVPYLFVKEYQGSTEYNKEEVTNSRNYQSLIDNFSRKDDYINATKLCNSFNTTWHDYKRNLRVKKLIKAIQGKVNAESAFSASTSIIQTRKGIGTFIHPLLAIDLAEWLNPEFGVFVKGLFVRYLKADTTLAEDIVSRTEDLDGLERLTTRAEGRKKQLKAYHGLHGTLKAHGAEKKHHAIVNKHNNSLVGIETRRKGITEAETDALTIIETVERMELAKRKSTRHPNHAVNICKKTGNETVEFLKQKALIG